MAEPNQSEVRFLIVGMARSGTTVAQKLACELDGVWVPNETHFWRHAPALARRFSFPLAGSAVAEAVDWFCAQESSRFLDLDGDEVTRRAGSEVYLWDLFSAIVAQLSPAPVPVLGEKTPDHVRWADMLLAAVPALRVVGIVRDPREVYRSHLTVPWGIKDPSAFAVKWVEHVRTLRDLAFAHPDRVLTTRYEDLIEAPLRFQQELATLLDVAAPDRSGGGQLAGRLFHESEWWKRTALEPVRQIAARWPEELTPEAVAQIEERASDYLGMWGYERSASTTVAPPPADPDLVAEIRRAGAVAASLRLPVTAAQLAEWQKSDMASAWRWRIRAEELRDQTGELERRVISEKRLGEQRAQELSEAKKRTDETRKLLDATKRELAAAAQARSALDKRVAALTTRLRAAEAWEQRAEYLQSETKRLRSWLQAEKIQGLESERGRLIALGKLRRLRARRWSRLGTALGQWRRRPWRLDLMVKGVGTALRRSPLPPMPDVSTIDDNLEKWRAESESSAGAHDPLREARAHFAAGDYEAALAAIETSDEDVKGSATAALLARDCAIRMGELTAALAHVRAALDRRRDPALERQARILEGRLRETDVNWLPDAGDGGGRLEPRNARTLLHVLKESLPFFERGYTIRSHTTLLAQRLAGFEPVVVTSAGFPRDQGFTEFPLEEEIDGITHRRLDLGPAYRSTEVPYDLRLSDHATMLANAAREIRPTLLQAGSGYRGYETALVALAVGRSLDLPVIYEIRSFLEQTWTGEVERAETGEYYARRYAQEVRCLQKADFVITIAEAMRDEIVGRGVPAEKIAVVPNVVDVDRFTPRPRPGELADRYGLGDRPVLGYVSNLGQREGIDDLIRAVAELRGRGIEVAGLVAGDGPERARLAALVEELGLDGHFVLTGHVPNEQIEDHYALIDLFVVPRINDRAARLVTPLKPLEAMAMGVPVIASDLPALRELARPGERGEVFAPSSPGDLADVAQGLIEHPETARQLADAARRWVLEERTLAANARRYERILTDSSQRWV